MRLLLVEDDDRVASALSAVLGKHGFDVRPASSGEEAIAGPAARRAARGSTACCSIWACPTRTASRCAAASGAAPTPR